MAYKSPHAAHEYLFGAALAIVHDFILRGQRRSGKDRKELLEATREIDLCARLAAYFGPTAHLAAQGTSDIDLDVKGPTIRCEVKYLRPPARQWVGGVAEDWEWLLEPTSAGGEFSKRAWVVFWPSQALYKFTQCLSVSRSHGTQFSSKDFAPFAPFAEPVKAKTGKNDHMAFKHPDNLAVLKMPGGKRVRFDLVGSPTGTLWAAIYTRTTKGATPEETACAPTTISSAAI